MKRRYFFSLMIAPVAARILAQFPIAISCCHGHFLSMQEVDSLFEAHTITLQNWMKAYYTVERRFQILGPEGLMEDDFS